MFCEAELLDWSDNEGNYWAISEDGQVVVGTLDERVAFFTGPGDVTVPWHGYPVGAPGRVGLPSTRRPPKAVIEQWKESGWIKYRTYSRLMNGRI